MQAQTPAEGILKRNDYGDSKWYQVTCGCGQPYHDHTVEVEADETGINVNIYATVKTDYWSELWPKRYDIDNVWAQEFDWAIKDLVNGLWARIKLTWMVWTQGAVTAETTIALTEQQALNYADTLVNSVKDVAEFQRQRERKHDIINKNIDALRRAQEGDCI